MVGEQNGHYDGTITGVGRKFIYFKSDTPIRKGEKADKSIPFYAPHFYFLTGIDRKEGIEIGGRYSIIKKRIPILRDRLNEIKKKSKEIPASATVQAEPESSNPDQGEPLLSSAEEDALASFPVSDDKDSGLEKLADRED